MDYKVLVEELFQKVHQFAKLENKNHINFNEEVRGENFILHFLYKESKKVVPSEISAIIGISTPRVAFILNSLDKKGFITREIEKSDRRKILVGLTESGKKFAKEQDEKVFEKFSNLLKQLGEEDTREFIRILDKIIKIKGEKNV